MKSTALPIIAGLAVAFVAGFIVEIAAEAKPLDDTGHYERIDTSSGASFSLDVVQTGVRAKVSFSAGMADGSGAAPDGEGSGTMDKLGVLTFNFTDSFNNEGTATLDREKDGYHLEINPTHVVESRALPLYGNLLLKKMSRRPLSAE